MDQAEFGADMVWLEPEARVKHGLFIWFLGQKKGQGGISGVFLIKCLTFNYFLYRMGVFSLLAEML